MTGDGPLSDTASQVAQKLALDLRDAFALAATARTVREPTTQSRLLEMVVRTAADVVSADAAALFTIDAEREELVFEVAVGGTAERGITGTRFPLGHGIAGFVAATGQPMIVSDAGKDPRHASDLAERVGYKPRNLLCVPMQHGYAMIGVLELCDKRGAETFSLYDMQVLSHFAPLAGTAIEQARSHASLQGLVESVIRGALPDMSPAAASAIHATAAYAGEMEESAGYRRSIELAQLVREIAVRGERETAACKEMLRGFAEYLRTRPVA